VAIDKSRTSLGVKVVLVLVALAMVSYLVPSLFGLFGSSGSSSTTNTASGDVLGQIAQKYTATVAANDAALRSEPTSYTVLVSQGNTYFDWGMAVIQAAGSNQALQGTEQPMWLAARQFYERAVAIQKEPAVSVDLAIAYFYSGETTKAIGVAGTVSKEQPDFAPAWFNLGVFYANQGDNAKAIAAFEKSLVLDPQGKNTNKDYATQQLAALKGSSAATTAP
jgi:tetratricopeptide (TPR) repeat protein